MQDVQGLSNRPGAPDCVKWSQDGVLAVAAGHSVSLLNPAALGTGPRAFASPGNSCDVLVLQAPGLPAQPTADAHHELANLRQGAMVSQYPLLQLTLQARSIAWSPAGCSPTAGCLLATVTNDHQVMVYGPPSGATCEWQRVAHLSSRLVQHLDQTGWRDVAPPQPPAAADATLRLRGGARRKRAGEARQGPQGPVFRPAAAFAAAVGQAVEVMTAEEGLDGCWFGGTIQELRDGWALVAYDTLQESEEEGAAKLREWFPVPGQSQGPPPRRPLGSSGQPLTAHPAETAPQLRPPPPQEHSLVGGERTAGGVCDAWIEDGWWEGSRVAELQDGGARCVVEVAGERHTLAREHTRRCLLYQDGTWEILVAAVPADAALQAEDAPQPKPGASRGGSKQAGARVAARSEPERPAAPAAAPMAAVTAAGGRPAKKQRLQGGARPALLISESSEEAEESEEDEEDEEATTEDEEYEAEWAQQQQEAAPAQRRPPRKAANPRAAALEGSEALPAVQKRRRDASAAPGGAGPAPSGDDSAGGSSRGRGAGAGAATAQDFLPHELPEGFSWRDLPGVDPSNDASAKATLALAAVRRFLVLRKQYEEAGEELPQYPGTSSHLKGRDAWLVERVTREFAAAYAQLMADLKWSTKTLQTNWLARLRQKWERTSGRLEQGFSLEPEPVEEAVLLEVAQGESGSAAQRGPRLQNRPSARKPGRGGGGLRRASSAAGGSVSRLSLGQSEVASGAGGALSSGSETEDEGAATQQRTKRRKDLAAATAAQRMRSGGGGDAGLASAVYQSRLLQASSLSCAWSPLVACGEAGQQQERQQGEGPGSGGPSQRCCFLAVGAKAGRIWLWRYRLPPRYGLPPPRREPGGSFELVGSLAGSPACWVTSLAWQRLDGGGDGGGLLLLAAGGSDGSVLLYGAAASQLAALPPASSQQAAQAAAPSAAQPLPMQLWAEPCPPDQLGVTTLALQARPDGGGDRCRLLLAAGKAAGSLAAWRSGPVAGAGGGAAAVKALSRGAASWLGRGLLGTRAVTGLAWLCCGQGGQQGGSAAQAGDSPLLLACSQDGATACYRAAPAPAAPALNAVDGAPQPASGRRRGKERGHGALGLALSPGGLFAAVARLSLPPTAEVLRSLQAHERVVQCLLQLDRLAGPGAPLEAAPALAAALHQLAPAHGGQARPAAPPPASGAWELACLLRLQAKWQEGDAELVPAGAAPLLQLLEQPVVQEAAAAAAAAADLLPAVAPPAWRRLQLATALRHLLHPGRLLAAAQARAKQELRVVASSAALPARLQPLPPAALKEEPEGAEGLGSEEEEAPAQPSAELLAQHGAFASLMVAPARAPAPRPPRPRPPPPPPPPAALPPPAQPAADAAAAALVEGWCEALERNEVLLLQRGLHAELAPLVPEGEGEAQAGGGGGITLSQLLMADWITLNVQHPLLLNDMLPLAGGVYMLAGEEIPVPEGSGMPARETSLLLDAPVALSGGGVAAATRAEVGGVPLPRCPASLLLCERRPHWVCRVCQRQYRQLASTGEEGPDGAALPTCTFCGQLLGPSGTSIIFSPPCCA